MTTKIVNLQLENLKRVKALHLKPTADGLTVIGGRNGQGKTTVLDSILWGLGGGRYAPSQPKREGAMNNPVVDIELSNGLRVTRTGKNSTLTVLDDQGKRAGQKLLDAFINELALNLPKFLQGNNKEKASVLLSALGIGEKLEQLDRAEQQLYNKRHAIGQIATSKQKHAEELPEYPDVPDTPVSVSDLIKQQQAILAKNGENQRLRDQRDKLEEKVARANEYVAELEAKLEEARETQRKLKDDLIIAAKTANMLEDESTAELEQAITDAEQINASVRANQAKAAAHEEAAQVQADYDALTGEIEDVRRERMALLDNANLPLPELTIEDGELVYRGKKWDCMAASEQLKVAVAIVRSVNPNCGFVLLDKLEQMDTETMREFGAWLEQEKLQVIATRVSDRADECTLIIEDGLAQGATYIDTVTQETETDDDDEEGF